MQDDLNTNNPQEPSKGNAWVKIKSILSVGHQLWLTTLPLLFGMNVYMDRDKFIFDNLSFINQIRSQREQASQLLSNNDQDSLARQTTCSKYEKFKLLGSKGAAQAMSGIHRLNYDPSRLDLKGMDLSGVELQEWKVFGSFSIRGGANLKGDDLACTDLSDANLTGANLTDVNLAGANLTGANLAGANLAGANLTGVNLTGVTLTGANLNARALESFQNIIVCKVIGVDGKPVKNIGTCDGN
jgi:uncharacterized protein YjbI with pentapeptide repeats